MTAKRSRKEHAHALGRLLAAAPTGMTVDQMMTATGLSFSTVRNALSYLRRELGAADLITLICDPPGDGGRWIYRLVGTFEDAKPWAANRIGDAEARLTTMAAVMAPLSRRLDGRSIEGRKARVIERAARRALEDLADLDGRFPI